MDLLNLNNHDTTSKKKKNKKHLKRSKSDNESYTDTLSTELKNRKPNEGYERVFSRDKHQTAPYVSNNNSYISKKSKSSDTTYSLQDSNGHTSDFENETLNTSSTKQDSELFFFDITGNRSNSFASSLATFSDVPVIGKKNRKASFLISSEENLSAESNSKKSRKSSHVEPVPDMRNNEGKTTSSENLVKGCDGRPFVNEIVDVGDRKKKKKRNLFQTDLSLINETERKLEKLKKQNHHIDSILDRSKKKLCIQNEEVLNHEENTDTSISTFKKPKKSKKHKSKTTVDIRDSECEMSFSDAAVPKKKTSKKTPITLNVSEEPNSEMSGLKLPKRSKKHKEVEALVDIRDSDCEMSYTDVSFRKKKKKKKIPTDAETPDEESTPKMKNRDDFIDSVEPNSFKSTKRLKKKHSKILVDIRDSDCEMSVSGISARKKNMGNEVDSIQETTGESTSFKSPKKSKRKHSEILVDIRDSDCEMSVSGVPSHKKRKKKKVPIENEVLDAESTPKMENVGNFIDDIIQETNEEPNGFKSSKKLKKRHSKISVDIRDSDCEMSVSGVSSRKKKKKKKIPIDNEVLDAESTPQIKNVDDIEFDNVQESNEEPNGFKSSKKLKKKRVEVLVDIRDSDCEMSVSDKKKKKKRIPVENGGQDAESTPKLKNGVNLIDDIENDFQKTNENPIGINSLQKFKKKHSKILLDTGDSCEISVSGISENVSSRKKKKKKEISIENELPDAERTPKMKNGIGFNDDNEIDNVQEQNEAPNSFKSSEKSNKKQSEILVDIRDSDCEMSFNAAPSHRKKKKKKILVEDEVPNTKSTPKIKNEDNFNTAVELDVLINKELNSIKSEKKLKTKHSAILVDIKGDRENSLSDVSIRRKKNILVEKLSEEEKSAAITKNAEVCNRDVKHDDTILNSINFPKRLKKNPSENLVDIRGSACESFSDISVHNKKKRKKVCMENQLADEKEIVRKIKSEDNCKNNVEHDDIVSNSIKPPKELMKKHSEILVDIGDIKCEMNSIDVTPPKKKTKKVVIKGEALDQEEKTFKSKNGGILITDVDYDTSEENEAAISYNNEETNKKKNKYDSPHDDIFKRVGSSGSKTSPGVKSEKVEVNVNCNDFQNNLIPIGQIDAFPLEIRNHDLTSIEYNGRLLKTRYNSIYTSSSEGYQSDDSEIAIHVSTRKDVFNNMPTIIKNNHNADGVEGLNGQKYIIQEEPNCTFNKESKTDVAECKKPLVNGSKCRDDEDQTSDDSVEYIDVPHSTKEYNEAKEIKAEAGEDIKQKTTKWMTKKSIFAKKFEKSHQDKKNTTEEASYLLDISKHLKQEADEDDIGTVRQLTVLLPFDVPPLHAILTRTTTPTKQQLEQIKQCNLQVKSGPFSEEEDRIIINNFKRFYEEHNLAVNPSVFTSFPRRVKMAEKMKFLRYLAHGLDNRLLDRVHVRFKKLLRSKNLKSGRFSRKEDEDILKFINETNSQTPFRDLAGILNRSKESVLRRYYLLTSDQYETTVKWSPEMVDRLLMYMMKVTKCDKLKRLKRRKLTPKEWKKLAKKMDVPVSKLQRAWNITIYPRLFAKHIHLNGLKRVKEDIINTLYKRKEQDWRSVNWELIATRYKGFTPRKIYSMFSHTVNYHVPESMQKNLGDCLDFLVNEVLKRGNLRTTNKFRKFSYEQGRIVYKQESESD